MRFRKKGDYAHNCDVLKTGQGKLLVYKRPGSGTHENPRDYLPCNSCMGFFQKRKHLATQEKNALETMKQQHLVLNKRHQKEGASLLPISTEVLDKLKDVLDGMKPDEVGYTVRNDKFLCKLGEHVL